MSFVLRKNNNIIATVSEWSPWSFSVRTNTSFPAQVENSFIWTEGEYDLRWVDDPIPEEPI